MMGWWPRLWTIGPVLLVAAVLAGCGGGDDGGPFAVDSPSSSPAATGDGAAGSGSVASIDPATMPPPATAELEVDGDTITYQPQDPEDTRLFTCDLGADRITVNMQTPDGHDLLVQVSKLDTGEWSGSIVAKSRDSDRNYQGSPPYGSQAFAVDGQYLAFVGPFEYYTPDDRVNFIDAGEAHLLVTCP